MKRGAPPRKTVGFLIDHTDSQYQYSILQGISDCAEYRNVNLICFEGGIIRSDRHYDYERNIIYELATKRRLDGLIILSDAIAHLLDDDTLLKFRDSFLPLPVVFVGRGHPQVPSIVIDSSTGMKQLVHHLVVDHAYTSFAFIKGLAGSYHAEVRFQTFLETLAMHNIMVDHDLIFEGDYLEPSGWMAIQTMLDEYKKTPEAVIACNDEMAIGALNELQRRGIDVPGDVAVVGFDDILKCSTTHPPLTTVRQPLIKEGWTSMDTLLWILEGEKAPMGYSLSSRLVTRESCGCTLVEEGVSLDTSRVYTIEPDDPVGEFDKRNRCAQKIESILDSIAFEFKEKTEADLSRDFVSNYFDALYEQDSKKFLNLWDEFLDCNLHLEADEILLKGILDTLYDFPLHIKQRELSPKTLYYVALGMLQKKANLKIRESYNQSLKESWVLNYLRDELDICLKREQIVEILYRNLRALGIWAAYLAVFDAEDDPEMPSRLVLGYSGEVRHPLSIEGLPFSAKEIIPDELYNDKERFSCIVESLHYANKKIGFLLLDLDNHINSIYGGLRRIVSSIIRSIDLVRKIEAHKSELIVSLEQVRRTMGGVIKTLSITVETKDPYTAGHQRRVSDLSRAIAQKMGLPSDAVEGIRVAASVHDIGKIYTPSEILNKPGELMAIEFDLIKHHSEAGYNILKNIEFPWPVANIVLQHHERCDGSGYPHGLKRDDILLSARIICVADVVEALISMRPYREALGLEVALAEIEKHRGTKYDEDAVDACIILFTEDGYQMPSLRELNGI